MSIFATVSALPGRTAAQRVGNTIRNTAQSILEGRDSDFLLGRAEMSVRLDGGLALISCIRSDWEVDRVDILRTVAVQRGGDRNWQVLRTGGVGIAETRSLEAAVSVALEYAGAAALASVQHQHDTTAV